MAYNVLIVDDSPGMRKVIRKILTLSGFETGLCLEAADGLEALSVLRQQPVDVVLTDINMPNMNGEEFIEQLSLDPKHNRIPVIVVSTDRSEERLHRMLALGARGYVTKPFVAQTLAAALVGVTEGA
jgi:two-component system, chemotaxis family, chemotaxis protein CheY